MKVHHTAAVLLFLLLSAWGGMVHAGDIQPTPLSRIVFFVH